MGSIGIEDGPTGKLNEGSASCNSLFHVHEKSNMVARLDHMAVIATTLSVGSAYVEAALGVARRRGHGGPVVVASSLLQRALSRARMSPMQRRFTFGM